jgi:hypothetical protein
LTLDRDKLAKILGMLGSDPTRSSATPKQAGRRCCINPASLTARGVQTDDEAMAAEYKLWRARAENEKLHETVMQLTVEINYLRKRAARRLVHLILDGVKRAGQALRAFAIASDRILRRPYPVPTPGLQWPQAPQKSRHEAPSIAPEIALVRRQLASRLRDSERWPRRVVVHGLAAAGIAFAIGIVTFLSLQDVAKLRGPSVQSGTTALSRQAAPDATARSNGSPAEAEQHGSVSDQPSNAAMATPESVAKPAPPDAGRAPVENISTLSATLPSAITVPDQTAEAPEAQSNLASPVPEEKQAATSTTSPATSPTATRSPSNQQQPAEITALVTRGDAFLSAGDIVSARLFYERAADGGDGGAALRLGATFDPGFLSQTGTRGALSDRTQAASWYRRALDLGNTTAQEYLKNLERQRVPQP